MRDDEMVLFVESDFGYSPMVKRKQPATGVRRKVIKQFAPPPDDTPELAEARPIIKSFYLGTMDAGHKVDKLVKARRGQSATDELIGYKLTLHRAWIGGVGLWSETRIYACTRASSRLGQCLQEIGQNDTNNRRLSCCAGNS